jgi:hypothetical protein
MYLGTGGELYYTSQDDFETCEDNGVECEVDEDTETCIHCGAYA